MITCEICGATFKTAQGLAGHRRLKHRAQQHPQFIKQQLYRKVLQHMADKIANKLADAILKVQGEQLIESCMEEFSRQGLDFHLITKEQPRKAIILAAGCSERLLPRNKNKPDCLLDVGGKPILERQLDVLQSHGINHVVVVRGYQKEKINYPLISYYENDDYDNTGVLKSLFCAEKEINDAIVLCYGNVIYEKDILEKLLQDEADVSLVIDTNWLSRCYPRAQRSAGEAALVTVEGGRITKIGKNVIRPEEAHGEFFGLAKFSPKGTQILKDNYMRVITKYGRTAFHTSPSVERAYFCDMIQELIDQGYTIHNVDVQGGWIEVDTIENLGRARAQIRTQSRN